MDGGSGTRFQEISRGSRTEALKSLPGHVLAAVLSPPARGRGLKQRRGADRPAATPVAPAHAGMDLGIPEIKSFNAWLPRTRGMDPLKD